MDDTSALPVVATKPRPRMALVVGLLGATAFFLWAAAWYLLHQDVEARFVFANMAAAVTGVTAVVWAVWHLRSKESIEHRVVLAELQGHERRLESLQACVASLRQEVGAKVRQARNDGYVEAVHDFGINPENPANGDDPPPRNTRGWLRPVGGGGKGDVG